MAFIARDIIKLFNRIIESLGRFQDEVVLNATTNGSQVFTREKFAIQVRDVDIDSFSGEVFNVDLGSFEEALILNTSIPEEAIQDCNGYTSKCYSLHRNPPKSSSLIFSKELINLRASV